MKIPKLLKDEIQLFHCDNDITMFIEVSKGWIINESIYINGNMYNYNFNIDHLIKDCSISINTKNEKIISINPKYKKLLLSNDKTIVNMAMDCILNDAKDFIDEYLKKFK